MQRKLIYALILIGAAAVVLILNRGSISVNLVFTQIKALTSLVFLGFIIIGVVIGLLLK